MAIPYKNPRLQAAALIVVAVIAGWLVLKKPGQKAIAPTVNNNNTQETTTTKNPTPSPAESWEGMLKLSNNPQKGNLMLETTNRTIYIKTSRDFSTLIGKEVTVTYEGNLESFRLGDITVK